MCEIRLQDHSVCLGTRVYVQYGWGCSVSADEFREVDIYQGEESHTTSYPMVDEDAIEQVKGIVQCLCWQHPSADNVEDRWREAERPIR